MSVLGSFRDDAYFLVQDSQRRDELRARVERAATELVERESIAATLGVDDAELVKRIQSLGFNGDSARVLDLLPIIHVSWADGEVQGRERTTILGILHERGIAPGTDAALLVEALLERRPSEAFMRESLAVLRRLLGEDAARGSSVVDLCLKVAEASGGLFGLGQKTSPEERALMEKVASALGEGAQERLKSRLGGAG